MQLLLDKHHLDTLFMIISIGQRDDTIGSESRRHRHSGDESHSPKAANGTAIRLASVSSSSYESNSALPKLVSEVNQELLTSGAVILPGRARVLILAAFILTPNSVSHRYHVRIGIVLPCTFIMFHALESDSRRVSVTVSADPPAGLLSLPGNRDRSGRSVLQVCTRAQVWAGESCTASDLTCLLGYYYSTLR